MKIVRVFVIVFFAIITNSCTNEPSVSLTKDDVINHLKNRNPNYVFSDENVKGNNNTEPVYVESLDELDQFLDAVANDLSSGSSTTDLMYADEEGGGGGGNALYYHETRYIGGVVYMNIAFNINNCIGTNLNSWISGFTLGVSYNHMGGTLRNTSNRIDYDVRGVLNYNIFVEDVGTVFSENVRYTGNYMCN